MLPMDVDIHPNSRNGGSSVYHGQRSSTDNFDFNNVTVGDSNSIRSSHVDLNVYVSDNTREMCTGDNRMLSSLHERVNVCESNNTVSRCCSFGDGLLTSTHNSHVTSSMSNAKSGVAQQLNDRLAYTAERHPISSFEAMNRFRKNKELCDVVLLVDGREIYTHRVVLAACSAYFRAMFTGELAESRQTEVTLYDLDGDAVETLIDFCYTSQITVEECNVQNLLPAACLLQLTEIQDVCCEFLKRQLDPSNCLGIRAFADTHACRGLLRVADRFTHLNFLEVVESEEFLLLPVSHLVDILSSDDLNVNSEEQVYYAVMRWMHHNLSDRRPYLSYLLEHVRLPLLSPKFLVGTVGTDLLIRSDERCRDLVDEAKDYLLLPQERQLMQGPRTKPRKILQGGELLFAIGGWCSGDAIASAEHYDSRTHKWHLVAPMHKRRCGVGVGVVYDLLYAVGGHDGHSYLNSVERYDPHTNQWSSDIASTSTCRTSVGVAVLNGSMYAVGGQDGVSCLNFVECYDPNVNKWIKVSSMITRRLGVGVAVLNGQLYAVGGSDGQQPLSSVEHFDPRVGAWHQISCMGTKRKHLGVAVYNGMIYAVGGRDEVTELSSVEYLDLRTRTWTPVVAMTSRRSGVGLAVVNNQLIAIGGFDGATYLKSVELYDPDANCWSVRGSMNSRRLGGGVGVVRLVNPHFNLNNTSFISSNSISNYSTTSRSVGCYMNNNVIGTSCNNSMINDDSLGLSMTDSIFPPGLPISSTNQCLHNSNNVSSSNNSIGGNNVSQSIIRNLTTSALTSTPNSSSATATVSSSSVTMNSGHMNLASTRSNSTFLF
ncbi:hypothetical protein MN116_002255 [Schistosoma mekongi]|uniref:BTB domain-containing protein n=1 Tax=Schistosoma mekongi TaxID=38744 RepID=A0AAE1ZJP5_SCHME|nr:hypothetical protein MN116_002255 [Schistosoma mekongi]